MAHVEGGVNDRLIEGRGKLCRRVQLALRKAQEAASRRELGNEALGVGSDYFYAIGLLFA